MGKYLAMASVLFASRSHAIYATYIMIKKYIEAKSRRCRQQ